LNPYFDLKIFSFVLFPCGFLSFFLSALVPLWLTLFRILPQDQPQADHGFDFIDYAVWAICFWKRLRRGVAFIVSSEEVCPNKLLRSGD